MRDRSHWRSFSYILPDLVGSAASVLEEVAGYHLRYLLWVKILKKLTEDIQWTDHGHAWGPRLGGLFSSSGFRFSHLVRSHCLTALFY